MDIRTHLSTIYTKLKLLNVKHENMEMTVDSLVADLNECMKKIHQKEIAKGKISIFSNRKEALHKLEPTLEKTGQASSDYRATLKGEKEALAFGWNNK